MVVVGTTRDAEQGTGEQVLAFRIWRGRKSRRESRGEQAGGELPGGRFAELEEEVSAGSRVVD